MKTQHSQKKKKKIGRLRPSDDDDDEFPELTLLIPESYLL